MNDDGLKQFRNKWNRLYSDYSDENLLHYRDELRLFWDERRRIGKGGTGVGPYPRAKEIYKDWQEYPDKPLGQYICERWLKREKRGWWRVKWTAKDRGIMAK